jgi:hypothetical protein
MKKTLFYLVMVVLTLTSFVCLTISARDNQATEFIVALVLAIALSSLFLAIAKGWGIGLYLLLLLISAFGIAVATVFSVVLFYPLVYGLSNFDAALSANFGVYGIRLTSLVWPIMVLWIGIKHYQKPKQEETKKEESEKEQ